jgi:hypothetical protein
MPVAIAQVTARRELVRVAGTTAKLGALRGPAPRLSGSPAVCYRLRRSGVQRGVGNNATQHFAPGFLERHCFDHCRRTYSSRPASGRVGALLSAGFDRSARQPSWSLRGRASVGPRRQGFLTSAAYRSRSNTIYHFPDGNVTIARLLGRPVAGIWAVACLWRLEPSSTNIPPGLPGGGAACRDRESEILRNICVSFEEPIT